MKDFQVTSAVIEVSSNTHVEGGRIASFKVTGILPGCRKNVKISEMLSFMAINVRPLLPNWNHGLASKPSRFAIVRPFGTRKMCIPITSKPKSGRIWFAGQRLSRLPVILVRRLPANAKPEGAPLPLLTDPGSTVQAWWSGERIYEQVIRADGTIQIFRLEEFQ